MSDNLAAALAYLDRGWSVIPCARGTKIPAVKWAEYAKRLPTRDEIREWFTRDPQANLAVITGKVSGIVAVDVDSYKAGTDPLDLPRTDLVASTPRGGSHYIYRYPPGAAGIPCQAGSHAAGIDVRADGGYILVSPSTIDGRSYAWTHTGTIGIPPQWAITGKVKDDAPTRQSGDHWLSDAITNGLQTGSRNDTAARLAGYLFSKAIPIDVTFAIVHRTNDASTEPLESHEIKRTIESVYSKGKRDAKTVESSAEHFGILPMAAFMRRHGGHVAKWVINGWLPDSTIAFVVAPPEHFKTWLLFDLAVSVAVGVPFMGAKVERTGPVILIQQEDFPGQTTQRLEAILASKIASVGATTIDGVHTITVPALSEIPIYLPDDQGALLHFHDPDCMTRLESMIQEIKPALVIVDPLYSAVKQDNYMADAVQDLLALKRLRNTYGCGFMLAHHTSKRSDSSRESLWGSQFLNAFLETGWQIRTPNVNSRGKIKLIRHFKSAAPPPTVQITFEIDTTGSTYSYDAIETIVYTPDEMRDEIARQIDATGEVDTSGFATEADEGLAQTILTIARDLGLIRKGDTTYAKA